MLHEIFYWVLNMSILGGLTGLLVLLLRRVKLLPRGFCYALWLLPAMRLLLPFGVASRFSLMTLLSRAATRTVTVQVPFSDVPFSGLNAVAAAQSYFPITYKTDLLASVFSVASLIWVIVATALLLTLFFLYIVTRREVADAVHVKGNLYRSPRVTAPAVYGLFKPKIIIPETVDEDALSYILLHENAHIRRHDNLARAAALFLCCLHWFNPLTWMMLRAFFADMELACDTKVLRRLSPDEGKAYARSLVNASAGKSVFVSAFGGAKVRVRVENILSYKKLTWGAAFCFALLFAAITLTLLTGATV